MSVEIKDLQQYATATTLLRDGTEHFETVYRSKNFEPYSMYTELAKWIASDDLGSLLRCVHKAACEEAKGKSAVILVDTQTEESRRECRIVRESEFPKMEKRLGPLPEAIQEAKRKSENTFQLLVIRKKSDGQKSYVVVTPIVLPLLPFFTTSPVIQTIWTLFLHGQAALAKLHVTVTQ